MDDKNQSDILVNDFIKFVNQDRFIKVNDPVVEYLGETIAIKSFKIKEKFITDQDSNNFIFDKTKFPIILKSINEKFGENTKIFLLGILVKFCNSNEYQIIVRCNTHN